PARPSQVSALEQTPRDLPHDRGRVVGALVHAGKQLRDRVGAHAGLRLEPGHQLLARGQRAAALRDLDPVTWLDAAEALHPVRAVPLVGDGGRPFRPYGPAGADVLDHTHLPTPSIGCDGPGLQSRASAQERTSRLAGARPVATYAWI